MLYERTLFGDIDKVKEAIEEIKAHEPPEGYFVAFSGGKDSCVILDLVKRSGVKYEAHYHLTTVDPPELIQFIRQHHKEVIFDYPKTTMWKLIEKKHMPPTRISRYCCEAFKEGHGKGRIVVLGIRNKESANRSKRKMIEACNKPSKNKVYFHPIITWSSRDVWEYIKTKNLPYCKLYDEGFKRLGCIMCPMSNKTGMLKEAKKWPKYKAAYIRAFDRAITKNKAEGRKYRLEFKDGQEMMDWWVNGKIDKELPLFDWVEINHPPTQTN